VNITTARCGGYWLLTAETTFIHIFFLPPPFLFHPTVIASSLHFHYPSLSTSFFPFFFPFPSFMLTGTRELVQPLEFIMPKRKLIFIFPLLHFLLKQF